LFAISWEVRLDDVVVGKADFRAPIDELAGEADRLITMLRQHNGGTTGLSQLLHTRRGQSRIGRKGRSGGLAAVNSDEANTKSRRRASKERLTPADGHAQFGWAPSAHHHCCHPGLEVL
jgi:DNA topoisomerase III